MKTNLENLDTLSKRLTYALDYLGVSQAELARKIKVRRQSIQYLCSSDINRSKFAYDIADALEIDVDWLLTGKGEMLFKKKLDINRENEGVVPILPWQNITQWLANALPRTSITKWTSTNSEWSDRTYALYLEDNAMFPRFERGAIVIINPDISPKHRCFVLVYIAELDNIIFRQMLEENDQKILQSYNEKDYGHIILSPQDKILGCLVESRWSWKDREATL